MAFVMDRFMDLPPSLQHSETLSILMLRMVLKYLENGSEANGAGMEQFCHSSMMVLGISRINLSDILEPTTPSGIHVGKMGRVQKWSIAPQVRYWFANSVSQSTKPCSFIDALSLMVFKIPALI